jgi:MFS family permease
MSTPESLSRPATTTTPVERRRVVFATVIGTAVEWYDFFVYAAAAGLVFSRIFFAPLGPQAALLLSFATVGVSFLFRPLGAFLAGHFGDRYGRRPVLVVTLLLMSAALVASTGTTWSVTAYLALMTLIGLGATLLLRDRSHIPLGPEHEAEQEVSPVHGMVRA